MFRVQLAHNKFKYLNEMNEFTLNNWIAVIIIIALIAYVLYFLFDKKCSFCGKIGALRIVKRELINQKESKIKETIRTKDKNGKVIRTREVMVPATTKTFRIYYECKNCKKQETRLKTDTYKN
jgi:hypothetical protein